MSKVQIRYCSIVVLVVAAVCWSSLASSSPPIVRDSDRIIQKPVYSWKAMREQYIVMQEFDYSCGAACLATIIQHYWGDPIEEEDCLETMFEILDEEELEDRVQNGLSMTDLRDIAVEMGYLAAIGKRDLVKLFEVKVPVIVRLKTDDYEHFVVLRGFAEDRVFLADPIRGHIRMRIHDFVREWNEGSYKDGMILVIAKKGEKPRDDSPFMLCHPHCLPVQHELQAARRGLYLLYGAGKSMRGRR